MTTEHRIRVSKDSTIVMVDDNEDDFVLAKMMHARSQLAGPFVHKDSPAALFVYLDGLLSSGDPLPELVLMDLNMPGMNGIEATAKMREREEFRTVPVIAMLTSSPDPKDRERAAGAGVNGYFEKPLEAVKYVELFDSLIA